METLPFIRSVHDFSCNHFYAESGLVLCLISHAIFCANVSN